MAIIVRKVGYFAMDIPKHQERRTGAGSISGCRSGSAGIYRVP